METTHNNLEIIINHTAFVSSINVFMNLILNKSIEKVNLETETNKKITDSHNKLRIACHKILEGFNTKEKNSNFDQAKVIKKIYKTLVQNIDLIIGTENKDKNVFRDGKLKETSYIPDSNIFRIKNNENQIVTIIPGLDINLVYNFFDDNELELLWNHFYIIFVSSVKMITKINQYQKTGKLWDLLPIFEERITLYNIKTGSDKYLFNPYVGFESDGNIDVESMYANNNINKSDITMNPENLLGTLGIEKLIDMKEVNEQIKNLDDEDIKDTTRNITKMLGAEQDSDINDICETLVSGIVDDLQKNGLKNMFETAQNVKNLLGNKLDSNKMKKTGLQLSSFMENAKSEFENMKDEKGNPIGKDIFKTLEGPLNMMKFMNGKF
jgi:hypothetical protein